MLIKVLIYYFVILVPFLGTVNAEKQNNKNEIIDSVLTIKSVLKGIGEGFI